MFRVKDVVSSTIISVVSRSGIFVNSNSMSKMAIVTGCVCELFLTKAKELSIVY